ncbi:MAG: hypothetical protein ACE5FT_05495, partial [Candidatus Nanoarchaeia archaeon]
EPSLDIYIFNSDTGIWESQNAICDTINNVCTAQITHFTFYAVISPADSDGDGIPDNFNGTIDACPLDPAPEAPDGCPGPVCGDSVVEGNETCDPAGSPLNGTCNTGLLGQCAVGAPLCGADCNSTTCQQITFNTTEVCDGLDNSCSGIVDEGANADRTLDTICDTEDLTFDRFSCVNTGTGISCQDVTSPETFFEVQPRSDWDCSLFGWGVDPGTVQVNDQGDVLVRGCNAIRLRSNEPLTTFTLALENINGSVVMSMTGSDIDQGIIFDFTTEELSYFIAADGEDEALNAFAIKATILEDDDGDGIEDGSDLCPNLAPAPGNDVDLDGCPDSIENDLENFQDTFDIYTGMASTSLTPGTGVTTLLNSFAYSDKTYQNTSHVITVAGSQFDLQSLIGFSVRDVGGSGKVKTRGLQDTIEVVDRSGTLPTKTFTIILDDSIEDGDDDRKVRYETATDTMKQKYDFKLIDHTDNTEIRLEAKVNYKSNNNETKVEYKFRNKQREKLCKNACDKKDKQCKKQCSATYSFGAKEKFPGMKSASLWDVFQFGGLIG